MSHKIEGAIRYMGRVTNMWENIFGKLNSLAKEFPHVWDGIFVTKCMFEGYYVIQYFLHGNGD